MLEIKLHGRGGQGAQVACQILAAAFFRAGREVQAFAAYGGERRGAPVTASVRVDDRPIRLRCDIERADHVLVFDPTLLAGLPPDAVREGGLLVVNSPLAACSFHPLGVRLRAIDAGAVALQVGLGPIVSTAMLGAFAGATGLLELDELLLAVEQGSPVKRAENVRACALGYRETAGAPVGGD